LGGNYQFDEWHYIPEYAEQDDFIETKIEFDELKEEYLSESIERLMQKKFIILSSNEAFKLTGKRNAKKAILVRALYYAYAYSDFTLYSGTGNRLWLEHGALGSATKMHKYAIVLYVDEYPEEMYVGCSILR